MEDLSSNQNLNKIENANYGKFKSVHLLRTLEGIIFNLIKENFEQSVEQIMSLFDSKFPHTFNLSLTDLIYVACLLQKNDVDLYIDYIQSIQTKEEKNQSNSSIIEVFSKYLVNMYKSQSACQELNYIIEKFIKLNLIDTKIIKKLDSNYFAHRKNILQSGSLTRKFLKNYDELSKNNFELHKKLIEEGVNPKEIAKIIRNDEIEKLQEISSQENFDFNKAIKPSLYERYSFVNQSNVTLIDYAAFFGSVKCFKYLLMNGAKAENTGKYAVAGGNIEIIHLCEQNHSSFKGGYEAAIKFHRNDIFKYLYEINREKLNKIKSIKEKENHEKKLTRIKNFGNVCLHFANYEILSFLIEEGMPIDESIINESAKIGNLYLVKDFMQNNQIPEKILLFSTISGNIELVKYVFEKEKNDLNEKDIKF